METPRAPRRRTLLRMIGAGGAVAATGAMATACGGKKKSAAAGETGRAPASGDDTIMIIRHAEKPKESGKKPPFGITEDGEQSVHALTVRGWQRAGALTGLFAPDGGTPLRQGLVRPTAVYAASPHNGGGGLRLSETVTPLAAKLKLKPNVDHRTDDEAALAEELVGLHGATLVAWEHHRISAIVKGLGKVRPEPPKAWPDDRFDLVWVFTRKGGGDWSFTQVPQLLLDGDSPHPA
ncbi:hypothetical protein AB0A70_18445 [Streptomyces morookaense]|uniref:hypothetical protein n=1 Tax=Streptomyces morookaense TaxID=1970 RepID=UPI0033E95AF3